MNARLAFLSAVLLILDPKQSGMFELASLKSTLFVLICWPIFALQLEPLDCCIVWELNSCLLVDLILLYMLSSVCLTIQCQTSLADLGHHLKFQRIYIWTFYLYVLILLYTCLIAQYLTDCMFLVLLIFVACKATTVDLGIKVLKT